METWVKRGQEWIDREQQRRHPRLDLFGEERMKCEQELMNAEQLLSSITNITIDGADLILDRVFDNVEFDRIEDEVFRKLVKSRLSYPASKSATVEYLKNHFDDDVSLSKILPLSGQIKRQSTQDCPEYKRGTYPKDIGKPYRSAVLRRDHTLF